MALSMTVSAQCDEVAHYVVSKLASLDEVMHLQLCQRAAFFDIAIQISLKNSLA